MRVPSNIFEYLMVILICETYNRVCVLFTFNISADFDINEGLIGYVASTEYKIYIVSYEKLHYV